jgi:hypothetical protein
MTDACSRFFESIKALAGEPQTEDRFNHIKQHAQRNSTSISEVTSKHALLECAETFLHRPLSDIDESITFDDLLTEAAWEIYLNSLQSKRSLDRDSDDDDDDDPRDVKRHCKDEDAVQQEGDGRDKIHRHEEDPFGNVHPDGQDAQQEHSKPLQKAAEKKATRKKMPFDPRAFLEQLKTPSTKGKAKNGKKEKFRLHLATGLQIHRQGIAAVAQELGLDKVKNIHSHSRIVAAKAIYRLVVESRMYKLRLLDLPPSAASKLVQHHKAIAGFLKQDPQEALWWTNHEPCPVDAHGIPDETWLMPTMVA